VDSAQLDYLLWLALTTGVLHTLTGPDHYLPFVVMARSGKWSLSKTLVVTAVCGVGHVLGSVVLGVVGVALGLAIGGVEAMEAFRGDIAAWLLLGFGLAYMIWGLRRAYRKQPHSHWHTHVDGTIHDHNHDHIGNHAHVHTNPETKKRTTGTWALFLIFVFGPCEVLIPQLMYPASKGSWTSIIAVTLAFGVATICTMLATVGLAYWGLARVRLSWFDRFAHAIAGFCVAACGLAMTLGL